MNRTKVSAGAGPGLVAFGEARERDLVRAFRAAQRGDLPRAVDGVRAVIDAGPAGAADVFHLHKQLLAWLEGQGRFDECRTTATEAAKKLRALVGDRHEFTVMMRHSELYWMCMTGYDEIAAPRFPALIRDIERRMGRTHELAWAARTNSAMPLKRRGDFAGAARVYRRLLADMRTVLEETDVPVLTTRDNLAEVLACDGQYEESTALYEALLEDTVRTRGAGDRAVLRLRDEIASNVFCLGDHARARELWAVLTEDCRRHLGECAPETARQRTLQIALAVQDEDDAAVARWCRVLLDNLPEGFRAEDADGFRLLLRESQDRLEEAGGEDEAGEAV